MQKVDENIRIQLYLMDEDIKLFFIVCLYVLWNRRHESLCCDLTKKNKKLGRNRKNKFL